MKKQKISSHTSSQQLHRADNETDEQMSTYYDALMAAIREGIEDPDLLEEEDLQAAFSNEKPASTFKKPSTQRKAS